MEQINYITKEPYQGKNQANLISVADKNEYKSNEWLTFLQARDKGLMIEKGSKGVSIFKGFRIVDVKDKDGKITSESKPSGFATVFSIDQTEKMKGDKK